ncbi:hypothetical protein [Helicobacter cinaedi]|nr:hypothetical protein [Helicobacter cinaedi]
MKLKGRIIGFSVLKLHKKHIKRSENECIGGDFSSWGWNAYEVKPT